MVRANGVTVHAQNKEYQKKTRFLAGIFLQQAMMI
jgi:hypothetical protein